MKDFKIYLILSCSLLLVYLVAQYNKPAPVDWTPTLNYNDKIPFGTYIVYNQLTHIFPGTKLIKTDKSVYHTFHDTSLLAGNYIILSKQVNLNKNDFTELIKFVSAGNSVFISAFTFDGILKDTLKIEQRYEAKKAEPTLNFTNPELRRATDYKLKKQIASKYFSDFDTTRASIISKNNFDHAIVLSYKFGTGKLYLCANPLLFSNYNLLTDDGADYAAKTLSFMPLAQNTYWDEFQNGDIQLDDSPLRVFFTHRSLQWAYYLSIATILIFVLFEMKRRQRIIPVIEPLTNSTLDFVTVVGQVYYEKRDNANIAHKKILYFLSYLRDAYQIKTTKFDSEFVEILTTKLALDPAFSNELAGYLQYISTQHKVTDHELIELNKLIEKFYIKSR